MAWHGAHAVSQSGSLANGELEWGEGGLIPELAFRGGGQEQRVLRRRPASGFSQNQKQSHLGAVFAVYSSQIMQLKRSMQCFGA